MITTTTIEIWLISAIFSIPVVLAYDFHKLRAAARVRGMRIDPSKWGVTLWISCATRGVAIIIGCVIAGLLLIVPLSVSDLATEGIWRNNGPLDFFFRAMASSDCFYVYKDRAGNKSDQYVFDLLALLSAALLLYWISAWLMKVILSLRYRVETRVLIHPSPAQIRVGAALHASISLLATVFFR